jgi:hypothetical protein
VLIRRPSRRLVLSSLAAIILLAPLQATTATTGATNTIGNDIPGIGTTSYVVRYSYPSMARVGTNLTISLTLHLNEFGGEVEYIDKYAMELQLFVGANVLSETINGPVAQNASLYPGAEWGPENFTFPLTESGTGVAPGTSENATLMVTLEDSVFYYGLGAIEGMGLYEETEPSMQASAGSLVIANPPTSSLTTHSTGSRGVETDLPYYLAAAAATGLVFLLGVAFWLRTRTNRAIQQFQGRTLTRTREELIDHPGPNTA